MAIALIIVSLSLLFYIYAGYPLALVVLSRLVRRRFEKGDDLPSVSFVIAAHNEEDVIRDKLENTLALDYPVDKLEVYIASDGSRDATCSIAREYASRNVKLLDQKERTGKTGALNNVIAHLSGDIVVMSDANSVYEPDAVRMLVRNFADSRVGCVCGELRYRNPEETAAGHGEGAYWRYEVAIKKMESAMGCLLGANGGIFAYRRELREPVPELMANDFVTPVKLALKGHRIVYDGDAVCYEDSSQTLGNEFKRHARIAARGIVAALYLLGLSVIHF
ncbi:glycosyltransferase family 2 protein, partial [Candidatus Hydrogenedentota bacterium]